MGATLQKYKGNTDRTLAYKAVVEGDATLSGFSVVTGRVETRPSITSTPICRTSPSSWAQEESRAR